MAKNPALFFLNGLASISFQVIVLTFILFIIAFLLLILRKKNHQIDFDSITGLPNFDHFKKNGNYSAPKIPGIKQEFQQRQVLQLQRRLSHVFLLSPYKNGF